MAFMHCPFCNETDTKVIDSRLVAEGGQVRRRRECASCKERFSTFESAELVMPRIIKQNGSREPFNEEKLRDGFQRALEKRPVSVEAIELSVQNVKHHLQVLGEREIKSLLVGEQVMAELRSLDQVAYVRFASVYRSFQDISEFQQEIDRLNQPHAQPIIQADAQLSAQGSVQGKAQSTAQPATPIEAQARAQENSAEHPAPPKHSLKQP